MTECSRDNDAVLSSASSGAMYNLFLQVLFRGVSFSLNSIVLRRVAAETLGTINVRLTLLYGTILFISREPVRRACLTHGKYSQQQFSNLMWLAPLVGLVFSIFFGCLWAFFLSSPPLSAGPYNWGILLFIIAAIIELTTEPLWALAQTQLLVAVKPTVEGIAVLVRAICIAVGILGNFPVTAIVLYGTAQILYSLVMLVVYAITFYRHQQLSIALPRRTLAKDGEAIPAALLWLTVSFFRQSILKQFLTEGERYVMTVLGAVGFAEQGTYDIVSNLGSLVVRILFQPIEESYYCFFSRLIERGFARSDRQTAAAVSMASMALRTLLKAFLIIGFTFISFGPNYSHLLLDLYGGSALSNGVGPSILRWFCIYTFVLSINGISECFMFATADRFYLDKYNRFMVFISIAFTLASWQFSLYFGVTGFVMANCMAMLLRIFHSFLFICRFFRNTEHYPVRNSIPSPIILLAFSLCFLLTRASELAWGNDTYVYRCMHVCVGIGCLIILVGIMFVSEQPFLRDLVTLWHGRIKNTKKE